MHEYWRVRVASRLGEATQQLMSMPHREEVLILEGRLFDRSLNRWIGPGEYACRPPGMLHGPYSTGDEVGRAASRWTDFSRLERECATVCDVSVVWHGETDEARASSSLSTSATLLLNLLKAVELRLGQWVHALSTASACIASVHKRRAVKSPSALPCAN